MAEPTSCCTVPGGYCARVDRLFNLPGLHVTDVAWRQPRQGRERLVLTVETGPGPAGCPGCGVLAAGVGRRVRQLHDIPAFGAPVELVWRQLIEPRLNFATDAELHGLAPQAERHDKSHPEYRVNLGDRRRGDP